MKSRPPTIVGWPYAVLASGMPNAHFSFSFEIF